MNRWVLLLAITTAACRPAGTFACERDDQCNGGPSLGKCELAGWCSFTDPDCMSGARYDELAGDGFAGRCVGDEPPMIDASIDDDAPDGPPDAPPPPGLTCTLSLGSDHSCVRRHSDSSVWCWGSDSFGELGNGGGGGSSAPAQVGLGMPATTLSGRSYHSCASLADGTARCWGYNDRSQLGDGSTTTRQSPALVSGLSGVAEIAAARTFSCARRTNGSITCWGENLDGQLGDGSFMSRSAPATNVMGLPQLPITVAVGSSHACARLTDNSAWCWGSNDFGQLGDTTMTPRNLPVLAPLSNVTQIAPGGYSVPPYTGGQTCVLRTDRTVWCWGSNEFGQLGNTSMTPSLTPVQVSGITDAVELAMGRYHVCVRRLGGGVACWGRSEFGQVGDGTNTPRSTPVAISLPRPAIHIAGGGFHTCALLDDSSLYCWGNNGSGQLGDGTNQGRPSPVASTTICQ